MSRISIVCLIILAGGWSSCKDDPVIPKPPPPVINKTDTVRHALSIWPDSNAEVLIHSSPVFRLSATPSLPKRYSIVWTIDAQTLLRSNSDTIAFRFDVGTRHSIKAVYIDSTGSRRDSIQSIVKIKDTTVLPGDTSSHDFAWKEFTSVGGESNMTGCWVFGPNDVFVINGSLYHLDGATWSAVTLLDSVGKPLSGSWSGYGIFAFSKNDFWLTGGGSFVAHFVNNRLSNVFSTYSLNQGSNHQAWGTSSNNIYVVGDSGLIVHFDGSSWTKMSAPTNKRLTSISGTSNNNIWACGYSTETGETTLLHYDGSSWSEDAVSMTKGLSACEGFLSVWACDSTGHSFSATSGAWVLRKTDNATWRSDSGLVTNQIGSKE